MTGYVSFVIYLPIWVNCLCWIFKLCYPRLLQYRDDLFIDHDQPSLIPHIYFMTLWKMQRFDQTLLFCCSCLLRWCTFNEKYEFSQSITCLRWITTALPPLNVSFWLHLEPFKPLKCFLLLLTNCIMLRFILPVIIMFNHLVISKGLHSLIQWKNGYKGNAFVSSASGVV